jgi:hypothetical protein
MLNIKDLSRPELPKQDNYEQALRIGLQILERKDPGRVAARSGCDFVDRAIVVPHLERHVVFELDQKKFSIKETGEEAPIWLSILVLHYLNNADGRVPTGTLKHFREFKEGHFYEPAFNRRTKEILVQVFGHGPELMKKAALKLNGKIINTGDAAVELVYFPYLPVTCILWAGDEEFPPEASVLFDETANLFFSAEDMAVAGQMAVLELLKASRQ